MPWAPVTIRSISSAAIWLVRTATSRTSRSRSCVDGADEVDEGEGGRENGHRDEREQPLGERQFSRDLPHVPDPRQGMCRSLRRDRLGPQKPCSPAP